MQNNGYSLFLYIFHGQSGETAIDVCQRKKWMSKFPSVLKLPLALGLLLLGACGGAAALATGTVMW